MAISEIVQEIKTLSSRQVLLFILLGSLYVNFYLVKDNKIDNANNKIEKDLIRKECNIAIAYERKRTDDANILNINNTNYYNKKSYENNRKLDSMSIVMKYKK